MNEGDRRRNPQRLIKGLGVVANRLREPANLDIRVERPRAVRKMAKVLYGDPIEYIQMGADLRIEPMLARQIVEAHGSRGDLPRASLGRDMLTSLG